MRDLLPACLEEFGPSLLDALRDAMIQLKRVQDENKHLRNERDIWEAKAGAGSAMLRKILDQKKARTT
jgi:hypothetical protein